MDDLISRQAAIDALEREQSHIERPITETRWFDFGLKKAQDVLSKLPSAEPEIIYCKDCDQYNPEAQFCDLVQFNFLPDGHCSWGRRKEGRCRNVKWMS